MAKIAQNTVPELSNEKISVITYSFFEFAPVWMIFWSLQHNIGKNKINVTVPYSTPTPIFLIFHNVKPHWNQKCQADDVARQGSLIGGSSYRVYWFP